MAGGGGGGSEGGVQEVQELKRQGRCRDGDGVVMVR